MTVQLDERSEKRSSSARAELLQGRLIPGETHIGAKGKAGIKMSTGTGNIHVESGNPALWGAVRTTEGYNFTVAVPEGKEASLLLYKKRRKDVWQEIPLREEDRVGNVSSVLIRGLTDGSFGV